MTTFDEREKAFENKYQHDEELRFKVEVRRAKLFGRWCAEQLGLEGADADAYARAMIDADFTEPGHEDLVRKAVADFGAKGLEVSDHKIRKTMEDLLVDAKQQVMSE